MDLIIKMVGTVVDSNFDDWKANLLAEIEAANRELVTDDDFAWADNAVKEFKSFEVAIKKAKDDALAQTADISAMFTAVDEIAGQLAKTRLALEKQVKVEKERRKSHLIEEALDRIFSEIAGKLPQSTHFGADEVEFNRDIVIQAAAGKKTLDGISRALSVVSTSIVAEKLEEIRAANANMETLLQKEQEYPGLFHDKRGLSWKPAAELAAIIDARVSSYLLQKKEKEERDARAKQSAPQPSPPPQPQSAPQPQPTPPPAGDGPSAFTFTVHMLCDVDTAKQLAQEVSKFFGPRKEIVSFNLKRS